MPRRRYYEEEENEPEFSDTVKEPEDVRAAEGIPTLYEIRKHITDHAWNGDDCLPGMSNEDVFSGQCEYASTAVSEMLTGTGKNGKPVNWSLRVRGWYYGDLSVIADQPGCDRHVASGKHCHSWVEYNGKIIDPTFWQFAGDEVRVYIFEVGDPRYVKDSTA